MSRYNGRLAFGLGLFIAASAQTVAAGDQAETRIMLLLDGSSSMWTRVDGEISKIEAARESIAELVGGWETKMAFGVTTYGHREEGNCQDIETILPVGEVNSDQVVNVVNDIMPRGKTPLAAALREAAEALDYKEQQSKILLVSDGIENCGQDPCQVAAELAADAKDLSIDIIGLEMNNHQMGQLECIAINGNGRMRRAGVEDFSEAMDQSMTAAIEESTPNATLSISTMLLGQILTQNLRYVIYANDDGNQLTKIAESFSANPSLQLPAGEFVVEVIHGDEGSERRETAEFELTENVKVKHVFNFDEFQPPAR